MGAGELNRRVIIQRKSDGDGAFGQATGDWVDIAAVSANIRPIGGREKLRAMAYESTLTHTVKVRYRTDLLPAIEADGWRILYGSRVFDITASMDLDDARRYIVFECIETGVEHGSAS